MANKKKTSPLKSVVVSILALILGFLVGYLVSNVFLTKDLEFYLVGKNTVNVGIGSTYTEKGAVCTIRGTDYSEELEITYYNHDKVEVTSITTNGMIVAPDQTGGKEIILNRPFAFMIYDMENQTILFIGKVTNPTL